MAEDLKSSISRRALVEHMAKDIMSEGLVELAAMFARFDAVAAREATDALYRRTANSLLDLQKVFADQIGPGAGSDVLVAVARHVHDVFRDVREEIAKVVERG